MPTTQPTLTTIQEIKTLIEANQLEPLGQYILRFHPADIAELLDELGPEQATLIFSLLPLEIASEVLDETGSRVRQELLEKVDDEILADLLDELPSDDAVMFIEDLPETVADRLLALMEPEEAEEVRGLLRYEEETAGRLMNRNVAALRRQWTVDEALTYLRSLDDDETLQYLYVVDRDGVLIGVVPLRKLIMARPGTLVDEIMIRDVASMPVTADQEELAEFTARYDYFAIPIVDAAGHLLGVVTADDVLDVLEEEATEDIQWLGGSEPLEQPYFAASLWEIVWKRVPTLVLLFALSLLTDAVIRLFNVSAAAGTAIDLSIFIPVITGTGGNAGSQTVATVIRALAVGQIRLNDLRRTWLREVSVGLVMGVVLGIAGFGRALLWRAGPNVALVLAIALPLVIIWATTLATVIPLLAERFGRDPAVISGPLITTLMDASGLAIYFSVAYLVLGNIN